MKNLQPRKLPVTSFIFLNLKQRSKITLELAGKIIFSDTVENWSITTSSQMFIESIYYTGCDKDGIYIKCYREI